MAYIQFIQLGYFNLDLSSLHTFDIIGSQKLPKKATTSRMGKNFLFGVVARTAQSSDA